MVFWDLAGYTNGEGEIATRVPPGCVIVPGRIELDGDALVWDIQPSRLEPAREVYPSDSLLNSFTRLAEAPPERILKFARQHGVLNLDSEGNLAATLLSGREPIERWRRAARRFTARLNIAAAINQGKTGRPEDWRELDVYFSSRDKFPPEQLTVARHYFEIDCRHVSTGTRSSFLVTWNRQRRRWQTQIDFGGFMVNALALQLLLTVAGSDLFICSGCNMAYGRVKGKKRPNPGWQNFCETCGRKEAVRQADERRQVKRAEARRLHATGKAVSDIAATLNTKPATIRGWLKKGK